jgi:hypothetical protein
MGFACAFLISYIGHSSHNLRPEISGLPNLKPLPRQINLIQQTTMITINIIFSCVALITSAIIPNLSHNFALALAILSSCLAIIVLSFQIISVIYDFFFARTITQFNSKIPQILENYRPEFAIFLNYAEHTSALTMWVKYFQMLNRPYLIMTSDFNNYDEISQKYGLPVILVNKETIQRLTPSSIKTLFYPIMRGANDTPLRLLGTRQHVFIGHGESDKGASAHKLYRSYDKFCVPGQAGVDRFKLQKIATRPNFFELIGRPQLENLLTQEETPRHNQSFTILYAPTWFGAQADDRHSSLNRGFKIVKRLLKKNYRIIFKPHPLSLVPNPLLTKHDDRKTVAKIDRLIAQARRDSKIFHLTSSQTSKMTIDKCFNLSHALISDISSVIVDYLITDKPIALNSNYQNPAALYQSKPLAKSLYVINPDLSNLDLMLEELELDTRQFERQNAKVYYLGASKPAAQVQYFLNKIESILAKE